MIDHLSYSSISLFLDCPEAWRRKYIAQEPVRTSPPLVFGSAFHNCVEDKIANPEKDILSIWGDCWPAALEGQDVYWGADTPEQHFNEGVRILSNKAVLDEITKIKPLKLDVGTDTERPAIEQKVELRVPKVGVPIIGYIDVILEDGTPADFKTSKASWSDSKASEQLQSLFYIAALNQMEVTVNWKFAHLIFVKTKEPKFQRLEHRHKPVELFFLFRVIEQVWDAIEKQSFPLHPGSWRCSPNFCDFFQACKGQYMNE